MEFQYIPRALLSIDAITIYILADIPISPATLKKKK